MILVDAYALVALLAGEPAAEEVELVLRRGDAAVTAVNLAEAVDVLRRVNGLDDAETREPLEPLLGTSLEVLPVTEGLAWRAADIRSRHYDRRSAALSLADCVLIGAAAPGDLVATADPPLARAARAEGVGVHALADSRGRHP